MTCDECEERIEELEQRLCFFESLIDIRGAQSAAEAGLQDIFIAGQPLGNIIDNQQDRIEKHDRRLEALEVGEVDVTDVVGDSSHQIPIQIELAKRRAGQKVTPANLERATYVWEKFSDRAERDQGYLKLRSKQVKRILEDIEAPSGNKTKTRVMRRLAKESGPDDDSESDANLLQVKETGSGLAVVVDTDRWEEWVTNLEDDLSPADDAAEKAVEATGSEIADVEAEAEGEVSSIMDATPVTDDSQDTVSTEVRTDGTG